MRMILNGEHAHGRGDLRLLSECFDLEKRIAEDPVSQPFQ